MVEDQTRLALLKRGYLEVDAGRKDGVLLLLALLDEQLQGPFEAVVVERLDLLGRDVAVRPDDAELVERLREDADDRHALPWLQL